MESSMKKNLPSKPTGLYTIALSGYWYLLFIIINLYKLMDGSFPNGCRVNTLIFNPALEQYPYPQFFLFFN
jgi:hypothetical protein